MTELPEWVRRLELSPHPEGGWFRETWRSDLTLEGSQLPAHYGGPRSAGTAILFVLMPGKESAWHTVRSAELWLYHRGSPVELHFGPAGTARSARCWVPISRPASTRSCWFRPAIAARPAARLRAEPGQLHRGPRVRLRRLLPRHLIRRRLVRK